MNEHDGTKTSKKQSRRHRTSKQHSKRTTILPLPTDDDKEATNSTVQGEIATVSSSTLEASWLADVIRTETCAFLCGAGASVLSGFPTSWDFIECLVDGLIRSEGNQVDIDQSLRQALSAQRLEYVLQTASQTPGVDAVSCLDALQGCF